MPAMKYKVLPIPTPPATQARASQTFRAPPVDGSLTVPEMFDWHLENTPNHPLFVYSDEYGKEHVILWTQGVRAIHRSARIVMDRVKPRATKIPVVAILATTDSITYFTVMAGIFRAGFTACPISPRNSPAAVAHLFRKANVSHILLGPESTSQDLVAGALALLEGHEKSKLRVSVIPTFNEIYRPDTEPFEPLEPRAFNVEDAVIILHSSGSTNFPKPIIWTHYHLLQVGLMPYFGEVDFTGRRFSGHSIPMYHGMGMMQIAWTAMFGLVISAFEPRSPATIPDPDSVMKSCMDTKSDIILCLPTFVESWSQKREYVEYLKSIFGIICGGGSLNKLTGDDLWKQGVGIFILYACTEVGIISPILPGESPEDWEYFRLSSTINGKFVPYDSGKSELVIVPKTYGVPCVFNTTLDGSDAYATGDLFIPHPTKPNYWKVFGRVDDQIMHSTGEKTNPGPLENILNQDPYVLSSVMFGRGRACPGIIFDTKPAFNFNANDDEALSNFRNLVWPTVQRMNEYAPPHSRVFKEMILVCIPNKPFTYTAKNTVRRQAVIADYEDEIDALYTAIQETTQPHISPPIEWSQASTLSFIRIVVAEVLNRELSDDDDFIENGCDSLQATWIRNTVLNALEKTPVTGYRAIPSSFVYLHPSVSSLASYILSLIDASIVSDEANPNSAKAKIMRVHHRDVQILNA